MHSIISLSSDERLNLAYLYGGPELDGLGPNDVVWVVVRLPRERETPTLCGRIVVKRIEKGPVLEGGGAPQLPGPSQEAVSRRIVADLARSEYSRAVPCDLIRSWPIWRSQFSGAARITDDQAVALEVVWRGDTGRRIGTPGG